MVLATHAVVGGALGSLTGPLPAFVVGFLSHFILDAIPHWHYSLLSQKKDPDNRLHNDMVIGRAFFIDLLRIGVDCALGFVVLVIMFPPQGILDINFIAVMAGAVGGILPDALQFVYFKFRREPMISLQRFHLWIHATTMLDPFPFMGISQQVALVVVSLALLVT